MRRSGRSITRAGFLTGVRDRVVARLARLRAGGLLRELPPSLLPGKMLRTRLAARLAFSNSSRRLPAGLRDACVATEILHTASLCHDDIIDGAAVRRSGPSLWKAAGVSSAVLIGDWLLCDAISLVAEAGGPSRVGLFLDALRETCATEARHEIALRGRRLGAAACIRLAGGKAGPLFAFPAGVAAGRNAKMAAAFRRAAYCVGTAYQLVDDLLDGLGRAELEGKTLRTDARRGKCTLPRLGPRGLSRTAGEIAAQCRRAARLLAPWPCAAEALGEFINEELMPMARRAGVSWTPGAATRERP